MAISRVFTASPPEDAASSYPVDAFRPSTRPRRHTSVDSTRRPNRLYRAKSVSNVPDSTDDFQRRLYDPLYAPHLQRRTARNDGITGLVEFLKTHEPPPDNFMSIPEDGADGERGRWLKWANMAKRRKSARRAPPQIQLPDTAVSGTTIGGHRHIAITIPMEALPLGERPRSQYPVHSQQELMDKSPARSPARSPVRTVVNDKGVVTVLKTVNEDREASSSPIGRTASGAYSQTRSLPRTPSRGDRSTIQGYHTAPPSRGSSFLYPADHGYRRDSLHARPSPAGVSSALPSRVSSMANRTLHQHISIDGMLSQHEIAGMRPTTSPNMGQGQVDDEMKVAAGDDWPLKRNKCVQVTPSPSTANGEPAAEMGTISKESGATILRENPLGPRHDDSGPPTPTSVQSRRDRVRDRKRRDVEALRNFKRPQQQDDSDECEPAKSQPTLSPIRVVVNIEPDVTPSPSRLPSIPSLTDSWSRHESEVDWETGDRVVTEMPRGVDDVAEPTPPQSPRSSRCMKHRSLDRASLSRRREWRATREQERKLKEMRAAVQVKAEELAGAVPDELHDNPHTLDKEILRLYEAYREHRFRDMERRVRRLERNGDVWLRALLPVLNNLNSSMASSGQEGVDERAYMSDDEPAAASRPGYERTSVPIRRANSSHGAPRDDRAMQTRHHLNLNKMDVDSRRGSVDSDGMTGLDTIEPLMRELAGAARLRQMRTGAALLSPY